MKQLTDEHSLARVWLSSFSTNQLNQVLEYTSAVGYGSVRTEMAALRTQSAAPPLLSFMDLGTSVDPCKTWHLLANWLPFVISDWLASDMSVHDYYEVFVKGAGIEPALAQKIAEKVVTPDGPAANFAKRVIQSVLDLPLLKDIELLQKMGEATSQSVAVVLESLGARSNGRDNSWEGVLAGEQMHDMMQRALFTVGGEAYEAYIHGPKGAPQLPPGSGDPMQEEEGDYAEEQGFPFMSHRLIGDALGMPDGYTETGDPIPLDPSRIAAGRAALGQFLDDVSRATPTSYHTFATNNPEQGGLFSGLGRKLKRLGKKLGRFAKKALKSAISMAPMLAGIPIPLPIGDPIPHHSRRSRASAVPILHDMYIRAGSGGPSNTPLAPPVNPSTHKFDSNDFIREVVDHLDRNNAR